MVSSPIHAPDISSSELRKILSKLLTSFLSEHDWSLLYIKLFVRLQVLISRYQRPMKCYLDVITSDTFGNDATINVMNIDWLLFVDTFKGNELIVNG